GERLLQEAGIEAVHRQRVGARRDARAHRAPAAAEPELHPAADVAAEKSVEAHARRDRVARVVAQRSHAAHRPDLRLEDRTAMREADVAILLATQRSGGVRLAL